ncbi:cysteine-rich receptor-like protein kinase 8 [Tanacetum coccineum]
MARCNTNRNNTDNDEINSNNPLFLHQTDHPGLLLISKKLTGSDNYSSWKRSLMIALNAKNKTKIVTGQFLEPSMESELRTIWEINNDMLISWILNTVSEQINNNLNFINSASKLWSELQEHYTKINGFWDEFDALEAPYMCVYVCNCKNGRVNGERDQRKRLIQFLMGLDESYSNIKEQILLMQPLPSVAKAYTMVRQEEKQRERLSIKSTNSTIFNTYTSHSRPSTSFNSSTPRYNPQRPQNSPNPNTSSDNRRNGFNPNTLTERKRNFRKGVYCRNYGKEGHFQEECYKIMGYLVGHPLHGKYQPPKTVKKSARIVNLVVGQEDPKAQTSQTAIQPSDTHVSARMDLLQNQINQVLLML